MNESSAKSAETGGAIGRASPVSAGRIVAHIGAQTVTQRSFSFSQPLSAGWVRETCIIVADTQLTAVVADPAGKSVAKTSARAANKLRNMIGG
jgi:hypothetical protein